MAFLASDADNCDILTGKIDRVQKFYLAAPVFHQCSKEIAGGHQHDILVTSNRINCCVFHIEQVCSELLGYLFCKSFGRSAFTCIENSCLTHNNTSFNVKYCSDITDTDTIYQVVDYIKNNSYLYKSKRIAESTKFPYTTGMSKAASIPIDKSKIEQAVQMNIPISINTYTLPKETENYIVEVAKCFLEIVHQTEIEDYIIYCLNELTTNAKKANTKRIYFKERGFDIYDQKSYDEGILNFKQESLSNIDYYLQQQKKEGLYIKVIMHAKQEHIIFEVRNNVQMVATEFKRIFDRMVVARDYDTVDQAFMQAIDDTEGAGLGLIIMLLMLKKIGLNEDAFELITEKDLTINRITIPIKFEANRHLVELTKTIVEYIDEMPQFPEKIMQIQRLINDPDVTMGAIASLISDDVALTTDLLKLVNSVAFGLTKECMSINDAVKMAGLRGIQHLLYSVGTLEVLQVNGEEQEKLWDHTYKSAFFAYNIAKMQGKSTILEEIYVCALLHDMGKIVFSSIYPDLLQKINGMCAEKNIPEQVMQSVMSGMEHQAIGIAVAEKWHLPAAIVNTIKYQYDPESAPKEYYELVATVSFSEFMLQFMNDTISYAQIPEKLLQLHAIENEDQLRSLCETLNAQFHKPE